jgi:hypothetical protein
VGNVVHLTSRASTIVFAAVLLFPLLLVFPVQSRQADQLGSVEGQVIQPMQEYNATTAFSSECDPTLYYVVSSTPQIQILNFALNKQAYRPGETLSFSGVIQVSDLVVYLNCYGQSYDIQNPVSPSQATVQVAILSSSLQPTISSTGSFTGSTGLPLTLGGGTYSAAATASFQGATDTKTATFTVEVYTPTLSITYPSTETQAHPGDSIRLEGDGWIPNMQVLVMVDDNFNVTADSSGHFTLSIPISLDNPLSEGSHTITVEQANLMQTTTLDVQYRTLLLSLSGINPFTQGQNLTVSGNVTTLETHEAVPNASVTIALMSRALTLQTDGNGTFQSQVWVDASTKPGTYTLSANATRRGFRPSALVTESVKVLPATNITLVASVAATGAVAGVGTSLTIKKVSKLKVTSASKTSPASIGPGTSSSGGSTAISPGASGTQTSIGPGAQQVQPKIGVGQQPSLSPGSVVKPQSDVGVIRAAPVLAPQGAEYCIHCGLEIKRDSVICPECGLTLR